MALIRPYFVASSVSCLWVASLRRASSGQTIATRAIRSRSFEAAWLVGGVEVGAHRLRVAVDHDGLVAQLLGRVYAMHAAVVEPACPAGRLDALPDAVGAAAEHHDLLASRNTAGAARALVLLLEGAGVVRRAGICLLGVPPPASRPASCSRSNKERASPRRSFGEGGVGLSAVAVLRCAASHRTAGSARAIAVRPAHPQPSAGPPLPSLTQPTHLLAEPRGDSLATADRPGGGLGMGWTHCDGTSGDLFLHPVIDCPSNPITPPTQ
jgi:hypothetical protein